ncbi:hypothetical protein D3C84_801140 [compost metagenome]
MRIQVIRGTCQHRLRYLHVKFQVIDVQAVQRHVEQRIADIIDARAILEVQVDLAGVGKAEHDLGIEPVKHADVDPGADIGVLVFQLTVRPVCQPQQVVVDCRFGAVIGVHQPRADAHRQVVGQLVGIGRLQRHADDGGFLGEIAAGPVIVIVQGQPEVAIHAKTDTRTLIQLVADEETGAGQILQRIATFVAVELVAAIA